MPINGAQDGYFERFEDDDLDVQAPVILKYRPASLATVLAYLIAIVASTTDVHLLTTRFADVQTEFGLLTEDAEAAWKEQFSFSWTMIAAAAALMTGHLADRVSRTLLFALILSFGKVLCLMVFFSTSYRQLFALNVLMGITVGGLPPVVCSLAGDMFPTYSRISMLSVWTAGLWAGPLLGSHLAGQLPPLYSWRVAFLAAAVPGLICAVLLLLLPEPPRGQNELAVREKQDGQEQSCPYRQGVTGIKLTNMMFIPSNLLAFLQTIPAALPWVIMGTYFSQYLFHEKGFALQVAAEVMLVFQACNCAGVLIGGLIGQEIYNRCRYGFPVFLGVTTLLGVTPTLWIINRLPALHEDALQDARLMALNAQTTQTLYYLAATAGLLTAMARGNLHSALLNVNKPEIRGTAAGMFYSLMFLFSAWAPTVLVKVLEVTGGWTLALNVCIWMGAGSGIAVLLIGFTITNDEIVLQGQLAQAMEMQMQLEMVDMGMGGDPDNYDPINVDLADDPEPSYHQAAAEDIAREAEPDEWDEFNQPHTHPTTPEFNSHSYGAAHRSASMGSVYSLGDGTICDIPKPGSRSSTPT